jgi:tRNA A-37 threonylcarbamoyl transferase component Bud32
MARILREKGFNVPEPVGLGVIRGAPHIIFKYAENAINLIGEDSSYDKPKLLRNLKEQEVKIYKDLGTYVRRMFDSGIIDQDMAKRNFMAQFDTDGKYQRVFQVDFEKTTVSNEGIEGRSRDKAIKDLTEQMSKSERKYFHQGYNR